LEQKQDPEAVRVMARMLSETDLLGNELKALERKWNFTMLKDYKLRKYFFD